MITAEFEQKYHLAPIGEYDAPQNYYYSFLVQTDHIPNKIIEAQAMGQPTQDYTDILQARQYARDQINILLEDI